MSCPEIDLSSPLTPEEVDAIHATWDLVNMDLKGHGVKFFISFFEAHPEYQKKFRSFADVPLFELSENKRLKAHAFTVMNAIGGMVDNLDDPEVLTELLVKTGTSHGRRKLNIVDFHNLREVLLDFLAKSLGDAYTPTADTAWRKVLNVMMEKIGEGLSSYKQGDD